MKNIRKITAILLAAVMALTMLTACGGGSGSSHTEKERYVAGINSYLAKNISNVKKLTYNEAVDKAAGVYQEKYEAFVKGESAAKAEVDAKILAGINGNDYVVICVTIDKSQSEQQKIEKIADKIWSTVGGSALRDGTWLIGYSWGTTTYKDTDKNAYVVLREVGMVG